MILTGFLILSQINFFVDLTSVLGMELKLFFLFFLFFYLSVLSREASSTCVLPTALPVMYSGAFMKCAGKEVAVLFLEPYMYIVPVSA